MTHRDTYWAICKIHAKATKLSTSFVHSISFNHVQSDITSHQITSNALCAMHCVQCVGYTWFATLGTDSLKRIDNSQRNLSMHGDMQVAHSIATCTQIALLDSHMITHVYVHIDRHYSRLSQLPTHLWSSPNTCVSECTFTQTSLLHWLQALHSRFP